MADLVAFFNNPIVVGLCYALMGVLGFFGSRALSKIDFSSKSATENSALLEALQTIVVKLDERGGRTEDKAAVTREELRAVAARLDAQESITATLVGALDRLTRVEERLAAAGPRLEEAHATARAVVSLEQQVKTNVRRIDDLAAAVDDVPRATAMELRRMVRAAPAAS